MGSGCQAQTWTLAFSIDLEQIYQVMLLTAFITMPTAEQIIEKCISYWACNQDKEQKPNKTIQKNE